MTEQDLKPRSKQFAQRVIELISALPDWIADWVIGNQFARTSTSFGARNRAAYQRRSKAKFTAKLSIVTQAADVCGYGVELTIEAGHKQANRVDPLQNGAHELAANRVMTRKVVQGKPFDGW